MVQKMAITFHIPSLKGKAPEEHAETETRFLFYLFIYLSIYLFLAFI